MCLILWIKKTENKWSLFLEEKWKTISITLLKGTYIIKIIQSNIYFGANIFQAFSFLFKWLLGVSVSHLIFQV